MNDDFLLEQAIKRYDDEIERMRQFDNKVSSQIGFVGVIIAVLGFILGNKPLNLSGLDLGVTITGIAVLLLSIGLSVNYLRPKRGHIPVLNIREFYNDWKDNKLEMELIDIYLDHVEEMIDYNSSKLSSVHKIFCLTLTGLVISFIGIIFIVI